MREIRVAKHLSQQGVAQEFEIAHSTLSSWECGERGIAVDVLCQLAEYYGITPAELLNTEIRTQ